MSAVLPAPLMPTSPTRLPAGIKRRNARAPSCAPSRPRTRQCRRKDKEGNNAHKFNRGFTGRVEAEALEIGYKAMHTQPMAMWLSGFLKIHEDDMRPRIRETI